MFEKYLKENGEKLSQDYYGHPQIAPEHLYAHDLGFRAYCRDMFYLQESRSLVSCENYAGSWHAEHYNH